MEHSDEVKRICAEAYLNHVRSLASKVNSLQAEIESKKADLLPTAISYREHVSMTPQAKALEDAICDLQELIGEYATELAEYVDEQRVAYDVMRGLSRPEYARALITYYLDAKPWDRVCEELGYTRDGVMKLRRKAVAEVYDLMPEQWRRNPIPNAMT